MCSLVIYPGNGLGARHIPFRFDRTKANAPEAADAPLGRMMYVRWAQGSNRKVLEVDCVVPMTPAVTAALRAGFEAELDNVVRDNPGLGVSSLRMARPEPVPEFSGNWITCFWFQQDDSLVCNGVDCFESATVRMDDVNEMAIGSAYTCANGCTVVPWVGFSCPGGGGGGAGDGGDPGEGGGGGGGNGGGGSGHSDPEWCPSENPYCLLPLLGAHHVKVDSALAGVARWIPECGQAAHAIDSIRAIDRLYRGNPYIPDSPNHNQSVHHGETKLGPGGLVHVDHDYLVESDLWGLAQVLLHEGWHVRGLVHPDTASYPYTGHYPFSMMATCAPQSNYVNH